MATKFRGSKGSLSLGGNVLGNLKSWELNVSREVIDATDIGDEAGEVDLDIPSGTGSITVAFDLGDAAQDAIADIVMTNTDAITLAGVFTFASGKTISCSVVPTGLPISAQLRQHVMSTIPFQTSGAFTRAWAP